MNKSRPIDSIVDLWVAFNGGSFERDNSPPQPLGRDHTFWNADK